MHTYLAGVRHLHIVSGCPNPLDKALRLQLALRGYKGNKPPKPNPRLPHILRAIKAVLLRAPQDYDNTLLWAALCLGFFGFLRSGEFVVKSQSTFNPKQHITPQDIAVDSHSNPTLIRVFIKQSKADQFGNGAHIFLSRTDTDLCPVAVLLAYLAQRPNSGKGPLFVKRDGSPLTKPMLVDMLHNALRCAGIDPTYYKGHSFRIGAATTAAALGIQDSLIQKMGRWSSAAFLAYIRTPHTELASVSKTLGQA